MRLFIAVAAWQSWAVLMRHLVVYIRNWHTAALPPIFEPVILLLVFGVGLGQNIPAFYWQNKDISYLAYLAPGILAYTVFMTAFFQALFAAYIRRFPTVKSFFDEAVFDLAQFARRFSARLYAFAPERVFYVNNQTGLGKRREVELPS